MASDRSAEIRALLAEHFLLRHLPPLDLERLAAFAKMQTFGAGEPVFMQGDRAAGMMVVVSGRVRITSSSADGKEVVLNIVYPGEVFGEIALIDGVERTAEATAAEATELLLLERRDFLPYLERHPGLSLELLKMLCHRLRTTNEQLEDFSFLELRRRLAKKLVHLADSHGKEAPEGVRIGFKLTQRELAAMMGTTREAVNRQLRTLTDEGLIKQNGSSIVIRDPEGLEDVVKEAV
jgi:CRP-like cAMP-binding protein